LAGRELGADGTRALTLCHRLLDAYVEALFHGREVPRAPAVVSRLVAQVEARTRRELLDARTTLVHGERRFMRGDRYKDLPRKLAKKVRRAFEGYAASLDEADRPDAESLAVVDCAL